MRDISADPKTICLTAVRAAALPAALLLFCSLPRTAHAAWTAGSAATLHANAGSHAQGYLGVELHDVSDDQRAILHIAASHAVEVTMVDHDGPAGKAGLQPHDVVVSVDGQNIDSADDFRRRIRDSAPGRVLNLAVLRLGRMLNVSARLADREDVEAHAFHPLPAPPPDADSDLSTGSAAEAFTYTPASGPSPRPAAGRGQSFIGSVLHSARYTGLSLETMQPQLAGFFGAPTNYGLLVHAVDANSPASGAGLRAGDVVLRVDAVAITSTSDWTKRLRSTNGRAVNLTILRDKREQTVTLPADYKRHSLLEWPHVW